MRFISQDDIEYKDYNTLGGLNLFVYCNNNPIMNIDPDGNWDLPVWSRALISIFGGPLGLAIVGANQAYESSKLLEKDGFETFWWTVSGIFIGNAAIVAVNWNQVVGQTNFQIDYKGDSNFIFQESKHYTLWTSFMFSTYMKNKFYRDTESRSVAGIDVEMIFHYILYAFNNMHGTNGAKIQRFDATPNGVKKDFDAFVFEAISIVINPLFYFFR